MTCYYKVHLLQKYIWLKEAINLYILITNILIHKYHINDGYRNSEYKFFDIKDNVKINFETISHPFGAHNDKINMTNCVPYLIQLLLNIL